VPAFVDTHAHIQEPEFKDDVFAVIRRAKEAGVAAIVAPGVDLETSAAAAWLADREPAIYFTAGFHPHEASRFDAAALRRLRSILDHPKAVAVGEVGLDYYRMHSPRSDQARVFDAMLALAGERLLPVSVHCRNADEDVMRALKTWSLRNRSGYGERLLGVMHYFSGTPEEARTYVDLGFLISVHTSITHSKAFKLRQVATEIPLSRLVIETDSPYGAPQSQRGKRNEPAYVIEAAARVAELRGLPLSEVASATSANAARLFGLSLPHVPELTGARA
jgi:TatD DNase family protein